MAAQSSHDTAPPHHVMVLGHPAPGSLNHAIAERYCATVRACGQHASVRDLYALEFDPRLYADHRPGLPTNRTSGDVVGEMGLLLAADAIVLAYPIWFGMPPAMIKGYVDRVLGHALTPRDIAQHVPDAVLSGKHFATFSTSATTLPWLDQQGQLESLKVTFDAYLMQVFGMIDAGHTHFAGIVPGLSGTEAAAVLAAVETKARQTCAAIVARRSAIASRPLTGADLE